MNTRHRNLRTGQPLWLARPAPRLAFDRLARDAETEVLVVGSGVSGAFVAEALAEAGWRVLIADRRRKPLIGSTPASTALLQYEIDMPLIELTRKLGERDAVRAWRRSHLSLSSLKARTRELAIDCDMERRDTLYLAGDKLDAAALKREGAARRRAGLETLYLGRSDLAKRFAIRRSGALMGYANLAADPRRLASGYLCAATDKGARIVVDCDIVDVEPGARAIRAKTRDGLSIRCKHLVFATGYELPKQVPANGHSIFSTYAIATKPQPRSLWPERCFIWEASDPYLYMRTTADGRVICGGEDEEFSDEEARDALLDKKTATIRRKLEKLFPQLDATPDFAWCGSFGASDTGLPSIGEIPGMKNCWAVLGYGGNGITYSRIAAEVVRAGLSGKPDPDADLYAFGRS